MRIVWDEPKRRLNLAKHGLDFADLEGAFEFTAALMVRARRGSLGQLRLKAVGAFRDQVVTVVFAPLGTEAIISFRPASQKERRAYDENEALDSSRH